MKLHSALVKRKLLNKNWYHEKNMMGCTYTVSSVLWHRQRTHSWVAKTQAYMLVSCLQLQWEWWVQKCKCFSYVWHSLWNNISSQAYSYVSKECVSSWFHECRENWEWSQVLRQTLAAIATALVHLPIPFTEKKVRMTQFSQTLLNIGKTVLTDKFVNPKDVLPFVATVRKAIRAKTHWICEQLKNEQLPSVISLCCGATTGGLKEKQSWGKCYGIILRYFEFLTHHTVGTSNFRVLMKCRIVFFM